MSNIVLIGMPGSGKSTIGRALARQRSMPFIDTDTILEEKLGVPLQHVIDNQGVFEFRKIEGQILSSLQLDEHVISTGGSAVYSAKAMRHLGNNGVRVYLQISRDTLTQRIDNEASRGLAKLKSHTLLRLYRERLPLYNSAADIIFKNDAAMTDAHVEHLSLLVDKYLLD